jgi:hypothetical protein
MLRSVLAESLKCDNRGSTEEALESRDDDSGMMIQLAGGGAISHGFFAASCLFLQLAYHSNFGS